MQIKKRNFWMMYFSLLMVAALITGCEQAEAPSPVADPTATASTSAPETTTPNTHGDRDARAVGRPRQRRTDFAL